MENLQDSKIIAEQRQMVESGTQFRDRALSEVYKPDKGSIESESQSAESEFKISSDIQKVKSRDRMKSEKRHAAAQRILRIVSALLLCAVSLSFYSTHIVSGFRAFLSDGFSASVMRNLFGISSVTQSEKNSLNINQSLLNLLGVTLKKPGTSIISPYYSKSHNEDISDDISDTLDDNIPEADFENISDSYYPIVKMDLSTKAGNGLTFHNETTYSPNAEALLASAVTIAGLDEIYAKYGDDAPVILIIHTHGTEAYSPEDSTEYSVTENFRSEDITQNVVSVGAVMAEVFNENGINTIHCTVMHDKESYRDSYVRSLETIQSFIEKYPSIQYIFDVHRDSIISSDMKCVRPIADVDGEEAAQFMTVVGTDFKGANHPDWEKNNLTLAVHLQDSLAEKYPGLVRSINLRGAGFNAQYAPGSLLLEVGTCGNTLNQAKKTAEVVAQNLSEIIKSISDTSGTYLS